MRYIETRLLPILPDLVSTPKSWLLRRRPHLHLVSSSRASHQRLPTDLIPPQRIDHQPVTLPKSTPSRGACQPGDIISYRRATSSRNQRATSSESAVKGFGSGGPGVRVSKQPLLQRAT